jgi:hypothetical protein
MFTLLVTAFIRYRARPTLRQPHGKRVVARRPPDEIAASKSIMRAVDTP